MALARTASSSARTLLRAQSRVSLPRHLLSKKCNIARSQQTRTFLSLFKKKPSEQAANAQKKPILSQDDLFHPCSKSPFPAVRERSAAIQKLAPCPVCAESCAQGHPHATRKIVQFECPDCGWPTHCSEEHWAADAEHQRYCGRLREANEDEHDLRSGRRMREFELPGTFFLEHCLNGD